MTAVQRKTEGERKARSIIEDRQAGATWYAAGIRAGLRGKGYISVATSAMSLVRRVGHRLGQS